MSDTEYSTTDLAFAALIHFVFGNEMLARIEIGLDRTKSYVFWVPKFDVEEYRREWDSPQGLAISNTKAYMSCYWELTKHLKDMERDGLLSWETPAAIAARRRKGQEQGAQITAMREAFLSRTASEPERVPEYKYRALKKGRTR